MRKNKTITIMTVSLLMVSTLLFTAINMHANTDPETSGNTSQSQGSVLWQAIGGMTGDITTEIKLVDQTNAGTPNTVLVGTDGGAMAIDFLSGEVYTRYTTLDPVISITDIADIDSQGRGDFVITTRNQRTPNVIAVSTETGGTLWKYKPMVDAYTEESGLRKMETISWCVDSIPSDSGSGKDVIVSSWRNVYRLSGDSGNRMWTFEGNNDIWTVVVAEDLTGDNKADVLAGSQDGDIHLLNGRSGKEVWEHDLTEIYEKVIEGDSGGKGEKASEPVDVKIDLSLWSILNIESVDRDHVPDLVVSSEDGFITLISGDNGNVIWSKKIILQNQPNIDTENNVGVQSGIDDLLNFFNPRIKTIDDFDGDGLEDILVMGINRDFSGTAKIISSSTGALRTRQDRKDQDSDRKNDPKDDDEVVGLDEESILFTTTGTDAIDIPVIWSTEAIPNPNGTGNYSLIIPHKNKIKLVDTNDKTNITTYFNHPILENAWLGRFQLNFFNNPNGSQDDLMILSLGTSGLLVVDPQTQEVLWDVNNMESVNIIDIEDITGDGTSDLMAFSSLATSSPVRSIYTIDRTTGDPLWRYSVSLTDLATKGARGINLEHDLTGDGHIDILAYRQSEEPGNPLERSNHTYIFVINGCNGNMEWEAPVTDQQFYNSSLNSSSGLYDDWNIVNRKIASMITIADQNDDSITDIIVVGETGTIYLLDGANGAQLWNRTNNDIGWLSYYPQVFAMEDSSISGLVITDFSSQIFFSNLTSEGGLSVNYSWRYPENLSSPDNDEILPGSVRIIEDLNSDGRSDVMYFSVVEQVGDEKDALDTYVCHILSGLDGSALGPSFPVGVGDQSQNIFAPGEDNDDWPFIHDFNSNGFKDAVIFKLFEGKRAPPQIIAIDGQTHQEIWINIEIFDYAPGVGMPLRIIEDFDDDGTPDIAVGSGRWGTQGADIWILDGETGEPLKVIEYEEQVEKSDWNMAQPVYQISMEDDVTGDGNKEMIVQRTALIDEESVNVLELVDIHSETLLRRIPMELAGVAKDIGDINADGIADILITWGNSIYCLDGDYSLTILSPKNGVTVDDMFILEWNLKGFECEVFVDGISYGYYDNGEAELTLSGGEHDIIVETQDEFGGILTDTITVKVPKSNTPMIINISVLIVLIIFIIITFVIKRAKLKKRGEEWREKRRKIELSKVDYGEKSTKVSGKSKKRMKKVTKPKPKEVSK